MSCMFRATGFDFAVDKFLQQSTLIPDSVWHRGEHRLAKRVHEGSGFSMVASQADMSNPQQQVEDAIAFLKANQVELERLQKFSGVERICLDFGIEDRDVAVQCDYFPPELLRLAGNLNIGIEVTRYLQADE
ncbi:hypothetical protein H6F90_26295 [Trichocoleus sp. FACHB-591]|uniref:DUF4279 domain-containing protein n=1 Tax=Trichocoleus sp. FACHB-591 TaxID=2692872 RepID=UPI001686E531|nr:DUF4279 domain-containing protein [Trichocoleus sp. FACHB-591]MBD2098585.1 hypothetical protein [Trichocoleus sp. FACHB-591]